MAEAGNVSQPEAVEHKKVSFTQYFAGLLPFMYVTHRIILSALYSTHNGPNLAYYLRLQIPIDDNVK